MRIELLILILSFLAFLIGLLACSPPYKPTPTISPTLFPSVTLTLYNPMVHRTQTPDIRPSATIFTPDARFRSIEVSPPLCYPTGSQQMTCFGYVKNQGRSLIGDVTLAVRYVSPQGDIEDTMPLSLEQRTIQAGHVAPYRLQIPMARLENHYLQMTVISADATPMRPLTLRLLDMQGTYHLDDNRYVFTAELENPTAFIATNTRLIITLENEQEDIIGYRVADIPQSIPSNGRTPIRLVMTPLEATMNIRDRIALEAFAQETSPTPAG